MGRDFLEFAPADPRKDKRGTFGLEKPPFTLMNLFIMNFLKIATAFSLAIGSWVSLMAENWDHDQLTTVEGRVYREIAILGSDATGLTFRHRDGVAKLPFSTLSQSYRMLYEGLEGIDDGASEEAASGRQDLVPAESSSDQGEETRDRPVLGMPVVIEARTRLTLPLALSPLRTAPVCGWTTPATAWPGWWPDHRYGYLLTRPACRERAVREFLVLSGLGR